MILPMLAKHYDPSKDYGTVAVQPKLNGVRLLVDYDTQGDLELTSRNGNPFEAVKEHLSQDCMRLLALLPVGTTLDGELYVHGMTFQQIISRVKRGEAIATSHEIQYNIYDIVYPESFIDRYRKLKAAFTNFKTDNLTIVPTSVVTGSEDINSQLTFWVGMGFEGVVIRSLSGLYEANKRSNYLLKYKKLQDDEFVIVGTSTGKGKESDCIMFCCKAKNGNFFWVRPAWSYDERRSAYKLPAWKFIGKKLTVRFQNYSDEGIPIFPVGVVIRDYE